MHATLKSPKTPSKGKPARRNIAPLYSAGALRRRYAIPQALFARLLNISLRTAATLEARPSARPRRDLVQLNRLCQALAQAMQPTFVGPWLDQPNDLLQDLKPVEAIERGQIDLVWQIAEGLRQGSQL